MQLAIFCAKSLKRDCNFEAPKGPKLSGVSTARQNLQPSKVTTLSTGIGTPNSPNTFLGHGFCTSDAQNATEVTPFFGGQRAPGGTAIFIFQKDQN